MTVTSRDYQGTTASSIHGMGVWSVACGNAGLSCHRLQSLDRDAERYVTVARRSRTGQVETCYPIRKRCQQAIFHLTQQFAVGAGERSRITRPEPHSPGLRVDIRPFRLGAVQCLRNKEMHMHLRRMRQGAVLCTALVGEDSHVGARADGPQHVPELVPQVIARVDLWQVVEADNQIVRYPGGWLDSGSGTFLRCRP